MNRFKCLASLATLALVASCRSDLSIEPTAETSSLSTRLSWDELTLGPGDLLRVGVFGHPELSTPITASSSGAVGTRVDDEGLLSLPLAGVVSVGGLRLSAAREAIRAAYEVFLQEPKVDVSVVEFGARRYYLFGEVRTPGTFVMDRPLTLYQALAIGGGFMPGAMRDEVVLLRGGPDDLEVHTFDGEDPDPAGMLALRPDDFLFVRRSGSGKFRDELLPILTGISSSLSSVATVLLIEDRLND